MFSKIPFSTYKVSFLRMDNNHGEDGYSPGEVGYLT